MDDLEAERCDLIEGLPLRRRLHKRSQTRLARLYYTKDEGMYEVLSIAEACCEGCAISLLKGAADLTNEAWLGSSHRAEVDWTASFRTQLSSSWADIGHSSFREAGRGRNT